MSHSPLTLVKICGMTRPEDAAHAASCGADCLGVVFAESPRRIMPARAAEIRSAAPDVILFGLFVDADADDVARIAAEARLDAVQLHGSESPVYVAGICEALPGTKIVKALRVRDASAAARHEAYKDIWAVLLDAYVEGTPGGTGESFDWSLAAPVAARRKVILAGGLTPGNVGGAIRQVRPFMVDVSSGVESSPGAKDPDKVASFVSEAKSASSCAG